MIKKNLEKWKPEFRKYNNWNEKVTKQINKLAGESDEFEDILTKIIKSKKQGKIISKKNE